MVRGAAMGGAGVLWLLGPKVRSRVNRARAERRGFGKWLLLGFIGLTFWALIFAVIFRMLLYFRGTQGIGDLLAAIRDNIRRCREAGIIRAGITIVDYEEGLAAYLGGERDRGLALIAQGVEDGQFIPTREAYLQVLYDDPGFAPILATQVARQARAYPSREDMK